MSELLKQELDKVDPLTQDQRSLAEQLRDLIPFANKLGKYDAADYLQRTIDPMFGVRQRA